MIKFEDDLEEDINIIRMLNEWLDNKSGLENEYSIDEESINNNDDPDYFLSEKSV